MTMNARPSRLLIVDDNEMNRDMLARRLERKGYVSRTGGQARKNCWNVSSKTPWIWCCWISRCRKSAALTP